jgi:hypothetical protein
VIAWPSFALQLAKESISKHGDVQDAIGAFRSALREHDEFPSLVEVLFGVATAELIYEQRHSINIATKRANGDYGKPGKTIVGESKTIQSMYERFFFGGQCLGDILGERLSGLAESEEAQAHGHGLNAALLNRLSKIVPEDKTVRQAVTEKKLRQLWNQVKKSLSDRDGVSEADRRIAKAGECGSETEETDAGQLNGHSNGSPGLHTKPKQRLAS